MDKSHLTHDLNGGQSWGLDHPLVHGWRPDRGLWMVWDRHTGEVTHALEPKVNQHGFDHSESRISKLSMPEGYNDEYIDFDGVS